MEPAVSVRVDANRRAVLSSLWIFVLLNILFRDVHEIVRPGAMEEYMSSTVSEATFLVAGIGLTLFISMIVLTRVLPYRLNRWANLVMPVVALGSMLTNAPRDLDDVWFLTVEAVGLLVIARLAWTWRSDDAAALDAGSATLRST